MDSDIMVLEEIMVVKNDITALKDQIAELKKSSGLTELEAALKELEVQKEKMISDAMLAGVNKEGTLRLVAAGRRMRELNQADFKHAFPEIFDRHAKITITSAVEAFMEQHADLPTKEAKQMANDEIERYSITKEPTSWDVINLV